MRLGILIYSMSGGGAERVVSYLLHYFHELDIEVHLILMNSSIKYDLPPNVQVHFIENSNPTENGFKKIIKIPRLAYKYARLTKKLGITHSFSLLSRPNYINIVSRFFNKGISKLIISERSFPSLQYGYKNLQSVANKLLMRRLYPMADVIICNTFGNRNDLINNFSIPREKTTVIHNPIDLDKIDEIKAVEDFFDPAFFNMVTIGRLDDGKNHKMLINAAKDIEKARLYIFGDGYLRDYLTNMIKDLKLENKVFMMGFNPNPYGYIKGSDLFIFGSNHEGFPNVILEALACGQPVLTTNCQSGPDEILQLDKASDSEVMTSKYGLLVPVGNTALMAEGIRRFIENPEFASNCKENSTERAKDFGKEKILVQFYNVIFEE